MCRRRRFTKRRSCPLSLATYGDGYNRCQEVGPRVIARRPRPLFVVGRAARRGGAVMTDLRRFRRALAAAAHGAGAHVAERLRAGDAPGAVARPHCSRRAGRDEPRRAVGAAGARAAAALGARRRARHRRRSRGATPAYPPALAAIVDPPPVLWTRGRVAALERAGGRDRRIARRRRRTRSRSPSGSPRDLAARGVVVVSGLARGVDSAAHRGALAAGGVDDRGARLAASTSSIRPSTRRWRATIEPRRR